VDIPIRLEREMWRAEQFDRVALFFDMSNLYFAARDLGVRIDYSKLLDFLVDGRRLYCAYAYVVLSTEDSSAVPFLTWLRRNGFRVIAKALRRQSDGTLRGNLNLELAVDMLTQAPYYDVAVLVSGDGDFTYLVESVQRLGKRVEVASTPRNTSVELLEAADRYIDLEAHLSAFSQPRPAAPSQPSSEWQPRPPVTRPPENESSWRSRLFGSRPSPEEGQEDELDR
jgi:uncharacterized LabA/DUF88 family protein